MSNVQSSFAKLTPLQPNSQRQDITSLGDGTTRGLKSKYNQKLQARNLDWSEVSLKKFIGTVEQAEHI